MADVVKQFSFNTDAEGWTFSAGGGSNLSGTRDTTEDATNDTNSGTGVLQTVRSGRNATNGTPYWEWTGSWESLGVPAGSTVSAVNLNYDWRCSTYTTGNNTSATGPAELRDASGNLRGTFSTAQTFGATTSWATKTGTAITGLSDTSSTQIKLRIGASPKTGNSTSANVTLRQDWIVVTVTYTTPSRDASLSKTQDNHTTSAAATVAVAAQALLAQDGDAASTSAAVLAQAGAALSQSDQTISATASGAYPVREASASLVQDNTVASAAVVVLVAPSAALTQEAHALSSAATISLSVSGNLTQGADAASAYTAVLAQAGAALLQSDHTISATVGGAYPELELSASLMQGDTATSATAVVLVAPSAALTQEAQAPSSTTSVAILTTVSIAQDAQTSYSIAAAIAALSGNLTQSSQTLGATALVVDVVEALASLAVQQSPNAPAASVAVTASVAAACTFSSTLSASTAHHKDVRLAMGPAGDTCAVVVQLTQHFRADIEQVHAVSAQATVGITASCVASGASQLLDAFAWPVSLAGISQTQGSHSASSAATAAWLCSAHLQQAMHTASSSAVCGPSLSLQIMQNDNVSAAIGVSDILVYGGLYQENARTRLRADVYQFFGWHRRA
jgi:hypothetical protein